MNWYLVTAADGLTVVDAGLPGYRDQLPAAVAAIGRTMPEVRAIVLTHAHGNHVGFAESWRERQGIRVYVHAEAEPLARTGAAQRREEPASLWPYVRDPAMYGPFAHFVRHGAKRSPPRRRMRI